MNPRHADYDTVDDANEIKALERPGGTLGAAGNPTAATPETRPAAHVAMPADDAGAATARAAALDGGNVPPPGRVRGAKGRVEVGRVGRGVVLREGGNHLGVEAGEVSALELPFDLDPGGGYRPSPHQAGMR